MPASPRPAGAGTIVGGSALLSAGDVTQLETWLGEGPLTLTNIYTKSSGNTAVADFHPAVDGKGRTFSIIEFVSGTNAGGSAYASGTQIIGGYNPLSWDGHIHYHLTPDVADMTGFIFNLTQTLFKEQVTKYQTYNNSFWGPTFGGGFDLAEYNNLLTGYLNSWGYCDVGTVTKSVTTNNVCTSQNNILNESNFTNVTSYGKIEVFTISAATIPEPTTFAIFGLDLAGLGVARRRWAT